MALVQDRLPAQHRRACAEALIADRLGETDLSIGDVAAELGISVRQLQRQFREEAGTTFRAVLLRARMERARTLLSRSDNPLPVRAVAPIVGYRGASGLRQAFVRHFGCNPSEVMPEPAQYLGSTTFPENGT